jgi:hypothetical protein
MAARWRYSSFFFRKDRVSQLIDVPLVSRTVRLPSKVGFDPADQLVFGGCLDVDPASGHGENPGLPRRGGGERSGEKEDAEREGFDHGLD